MENMNSSLLNYTLIQNIKGVTINSYFDIHEFKNIHFIVYRPTVVEILTFLKLSSIFRLNNAIDIQAIDQINSEFRFTLIYKLQSTFGNYSANIVTKATDILALASAQSVFPAFNWAEREI